MFETWVVVVAALVCVAAIVTAFVLAETIKHGKPAPPTPPTPLTPIGFVSLLNGLEKDVFALLPTYEFSAMTYTLGAALSLPALALASDGTSVTARISDADFSTAVAPATANGSWSGGAPENLGPAGSLHSWDGVWWTAASKGVASSTDGFQWELQITEIAPGVPFADMARAPDGTLVLADWTPNQPMTLGVYDTQTKVTTPLNAPGVTAPSTAPNAALWGGSSTLVLFGGPNLSGSCVALCPWNLLNACADPSTPPPVSTLTSVVALSSQTWLASDPDTLWMSVNDGVDWVADNMTLFPIGAQFATLGTLTTDTAVLLVNTPSGGELYTKSVFGMYTPWTLKASLPGVTLSAWSANAP